MDAAVPQIASTGRLPHLLLLLLVCLEGQGNRCGNAVSCCHKVKVNGGHKVNLIHIKHVSLGSKLTSAGWFSRLRFLTSNLYIPIYCPVYPHISPLTMFGVWSNGDHSFPQGQNSPSSSPPGPSWRSFPPQSAKHPGAGSAHRRSSDCSITWKSDMDDMVFPVFWFKAASRLCWMVGHSQQPEAGTEQDMRLPQIPQRSHLWVPLTKWGWQTAGCEWGWRRTSCSERERSARQTNSPEGRRVEGRVKSDDRSLVCTILIIGTKKKNNATNITTSRSIILIIATT